MKSAKENVIFIVGPTGVGKTEFAIELAKRICSEIISADSMQAYRQMDIISQKPTKKERRMVPHHLIDILDVKEEYSAAEFAKRANSIIDKILKKKIVPIVVGGSGLYIKSLIDGLFPAPKKDPTFRKYLEWEAKKSRNGYLHERLKFIDPEAATKIHPNDLRRIIRALEIFHLTGLPISEHKRDSEGIRGRFNIKMYGLIRPRPIIYKRIEDRIERMFQDGLIKEVDFIRKSKPSITAQCCLGYKELSGYLDRRYSLEDAKELLKKDTKHFAKKQLTWFNADRRIRWIEIEETKIKEALREIIKDLYGKGDICYRYHR